MHPMGNGISIVFYDPFDAAEEDYVAQHYPAQCPALIARFYAAMREWRQGCRTSPRYEAVDAMYYPDMAYAGQVGVSAMGQAVIRSLIRQYRIEKEGTP